MRFRKLFQNWKDTRDYTGGEIIYRTGDTADSLYFILSGEVEIKLHGATLGTEAAGGIIGELAMVSASVQNTTATALTDVKVARLDRKMLKKVIKGNNAFSIHVMAALAKRLKAVDQYIIDHFKPNAG